ncbi:MAG: PTS glucose transporter subunit IIA [Lachnospiraceae bacterium]|nr:PTS glucose transporter subunit IIA [Lachnospiraceae bacterium]
MFGSLKKLFGGQEAAKHEILAPVSGKAIPMSEVADPTFSQEILGKGVAIVPSDGRIVAPADGEIVVMFETKHAVSLKTDFGAELIVHIGLDTVNLKGQFFNALVAQGDRVRAGDVLVEVDLERVKSAGYDITTPVIICNTPSFPNMVCHSGMEVKALDPIITL